MAVTGELKDFRIMRSDYPTRNGTCIRDYIHVSDLAAAHVLAMECLYSEASKQGRSLNLCTGTGFSVKKIYMPWNRSQNAVCHIRQESSGQAIHRRWWRTEHMHRKFCAGSPAARA